MLEDNIFGKRLNMLREEKEMRMEDVADMLISVDGKKPSRSTINKWIKGYCEPTMRYAMQLSKFFHVSLDWLIGATDEREPQKNTFDRLFNSLTEEQKLDAIKYLEFLKSKQ